MMRLLLHSSFWRFLGGFAAIVVVSFGMIVAVGYYEIEVKGDGSPETARTASVQP